MRLSRLFTVLSLALLVSLLSACGDKGPNADVEEVKIRFDFARTDLRMLEAARALQSGKALDTFAVYRQYLQQDRQFLADLTGALDRFNGKRLREGFQDTVIFSQLMPILLDKHMLHLMDTISKVYPETYDFTSLLEPPLKRLSVLFPRYKDSLPVFRTFANGYFPDGNPQTADQMVPMPGGRSFGIGLHYCLGQGLKYYPPGIPQYYRRRFAPDYLQTMFLREIAEGMVPPVDETNNPPLLNFAIREGIKLYLIDRLAPALADSFKICYTAKQMHWATLYEKNIYKEMSGQLYNTDIEEHVKYLSEKPYTTHLSIESAPRIAQFWGWQVVRAYMKKFPDTDLAAFCERTDYEEILKGSRYKPL